MKLLNFLAIHDASRRFEAGICSPPAPCAARPAYVLFSINFNLKTIYYKYHSFILGCRSSRSDFALRLAHLAQLEIKKEMPANSELAGISRCGFA